jgi:hypothetical protein
VKVVAMRALLLFAGVLVACLVACDKRAEEDAPLQMPELPRPRLLLRYAAQTEEGLDGKNTTFFSIDEDHSLFVVAEASNPDASKRATELMTKAIGDAACLAERGEKQLRCTLDHANEQLMYESMKSDFAVVLVSDNTAFMARAGATRILYTLGDDVFGEYLKDSETLGTIRFTSTIENTRLYRDTSVLVANAGVLENAGLPSIRSTLTKTAPDTSALESAVRKLVTHPALARAGAGPTSAIIVRAVPAPPGRQ